MSYDPKLLSEMLRYEGGELDGLEEEVAFFQSLIDTGAVWGLQGHYQRRAKQLVQQGLCSLPPETEVKKSIPAGLSPEEAWLEAALHIGRHVAYYVDNFLSFDEVSASVIRHTCYRIVGGAGVDTHNPTTRRRMNTLINRAIDQAVKESPTWVRPKYEIGNGR